MKNLNHLTHPRDIFKWQADLEAEIEHRNDPRPPLPKYEKPPKLPFSAGIYNLVRQMLP